MTSNPDLWTALENFHLDDPEADYQFSARLAHENGWPRSFAKAAVSEYKKFVYLAQIAKTPVTPSDIIDQVWHLHLTFTRSYWNDMCGEVLGKPLHHGPTKGGKAEDKRYRSQYAETLALYEREFGVAPPAKFWPAGEARFSSAPHQRWVDSRTHYVIGKPRLNAAWPLFAIAGIPALTIAATAASEPATSEQNTLTGVFVAAGLAALVLFGVLAGNSGGRKGSKHKNGSNGCTPIIGTGCGTSSHKSGQGGEGGESGGEGGGEGGSGGDGGGDGGGGGCGGGCGSS